MLEVYGSGYFSDTDKSGYKTRSKQTHAIDAIKSLHLIQDCFSHLLASLNEAQVSQIFDGSKTFKSCLINFLRVLQLRFCDL